MSSGVELFSYDSKLANKNPIHKELVIAGLACSPLINPLSPKSDQHQFSPQTLNTWCKEKVMSITKITVEQLMQWSLP